MPQVMPLGCSVALNHYHYLVMRTLTPLVILLISFRFRWSLRKRAAKAERKGDLAKARARERVKAAKVAAKAMPVSFWRYTKNSSACVRNCRKPLTLR